MTFGVRAFKESFGGVEELEDSALGFLFDACIQICLFVCFCSVNIHYCLDSFTFFNFWTYCFIFLLGGLCIVCQHDSK